MFDDSDGIHKDSGAVLVEDEGGSVLVFNDSADVVFFSESGIGATVVIDPNGVLVSAIVAGSKDLAMEGVFRVVSFDTVNQVVESWEFEYGLFGHSSCFVSRLQELELSHIGDFLAFDEGE